MQRFHRKTENNMCLEQFHQQQQNSKNSQALGTQISLYALTQPLKQHSNLKKTKKTHQWRQTWKNLTLAAWRQRLSSCVWTLLYCPSMDSRWGLCEHHSWPASRKNSVGRMKTWQKDKNSSIMNVNAKFWRQTNKNTDTGVIHTTAQDGIGVGWCIYIC